MAIRLNATTAAATERRFFCAMLVVMFAVLGCAVLWCGVLLSVLWSFSTHASLNTGALLV